MTPDDPVPARAAASGLVLLAATAAALVLANTGAAARFQGVWETPLGFRFGPFLRGRDRALPDPVDGSGGLLELTLDPTAIPTSPPSSIRPSDTWHFQAAFRDRNPGPTSNFTDAVAVTFS